jgi:hypothetical protein
MCFLKNGTKMTHHNDQISNDGETKYDLQKILKNNLNKEIFVIKNIFSFQYRKLQFLA